MTQSKQKNRPTDSELEILNILWKQGASSVREVHDILGQSKPSGYTTTLKLMQIMLEKGLVKREASGKMHIYRAAFKQKDTQGQLLQKMIDTVFNGSASQLVLQALGHQRSSPEELAEIRAYLKKMEKEQNAR
jgi:predicted transcriptional regulator